eukprot:scaffold4043_cov90-Isochrysis_galbana.AAC.1
MSSHLASASQAALPSQLDRLHLIDLATRPSFAPVTAAYCPSLTASCTCTTASPYPAVPCARLPQPTLPSQQGGHRPPGRLYITAARRRYTRPSAAQVKANRRCDAATDQLRQELQRTALREEYYNQQGDDAAKLTAENRLLIGRVEEMGSAMEQHKLELERLQQENASLNAKTQLMEERSVLLKKIRQRENHALQLLDQAKAELDESEIFA